MFRIPDIFGHLKHGRLRFGIEEPSDVHTSGHQTQAERSGSVVEAHTGDAGLPGRGGLLDSSDGLGKGRFFA